MQRRQLQRGANQSDLFEVLQSNLVTKVVSAIVAFFGLGGLIGPLVGIMIDRFKVNFEDTAILLVMCFGVFPLALVMGTLATKVVNRQPRLIPNKRRELLSRVVPTVVLIVVVIGGWQTVTSSLSLDSWVRDAPNTHPVSKSSELVNDKVFEITYAVATTKGAPVIGVEHIFDSLNVDRLRISSDPSIELTKETLGRSFATVWLYLLMKSVTEWAQLWIVGLLLVSIAMSLLVLVLADRNFSRAIARSAESRGILVLCVVLVSFLTPSQLPPEIESVSKMLGSVGLDKVDVLKQKMSESQESKRQNDKLELMSLKISHLSDTMGSLRDHVDSELKSIKDTLKAHREEIHRKLDE